MGRRRGRYVTLVALAAAAVLAAAAALLGACGASASPQTGARIAPSCRGSHWVASWIASPSDADGRLDASLAPFDGGPQQTYRMIITPHLAGATLRVRLTNRFGLRPVRLARVTIAREASGASVVAATIRSVRFNGHAGVTVPPGHSVTSDPVRLGFRAFQNLAVSIYVPAYTGYPTEHFTARQISYYTTPGAGDQVGDPSGSAFTRTTTAWYFIDGLDVRVSRRVGAVVAFGDSLTDGFQGPPSIFPEAAATLNANGRWPDDLQRRLDAAHIPLAVLDAGISGNRLLQAGSSPLYGPSGLARFRADALDQPGVRGVIVLEGTNDIAAGASAAQVESGLARLVRLTHRAHLEIMLGTIPPAHDPAAPAYGNSRFNATVSRVNAWITSAASGANGYVNFFGALRDRADPFRIAPAYNGGDGVHPNLAGYRAMARAVPLSALRRLAASCRP